MINGNAIKKWAKSKYPNLSWKASKRGSRHFHLHLKNWEDEVIPNDIRKMAIDVIYAVPDSLNMGNWEDISYGNVRSVGISMTGYEWEELIDNKR